jgi:holo-[acyl-carrier protein] synthase
MNPNDAPPSESSDATPVAGAGSASVRVGTDIVLVKQVAESIARFGDRYVKRLFTPHEIAYANSRGDSAASHFAARFAAKEATLKVLRPSKGDAIDWRSIEVIHREEGFCDIAVRGAAEILARREAITAFSLSLSHEADYALAVVVAERNPGTAHRGAHGLGHVTTDQRDKAAARWQSRIARTEAKPMCRLKGVRGGASGR